MNAVRRLCLIGLIAALSAPAWAVKPQPPLRLSMALANEPKPGETARIEITVHSKIDLDKLSLMCRLPRGLKLEKNQKPEWQLDVKKNAPATVTFELPLPEARSYKLIAKATAHTDKGPFSAVTKLVVDLGGGEKAKTRPPVIEMKDGEKLRLNPGN